MTEQTLLDDVPAFQRKVGIAYTREGLIAIDPVKTAAAALIEPERAGLWTWDSAVAVAEHQADIDQIRYIAPVATAVGAWKREAAAASGGSGTGPAPTGTAIVATRTAMKALDYSETPAAILTETGRQSVWVWDSSVAVAQHQADSTETVFVAPAPGLTGAFRNVTARLPFQTVVLSAAAMRSLPTSTDGVIYMSGGTSHAYVYNPSIGPATYRAYGEDRYIAPVDGLNGAWENVTRVITGTWTPNILIGGQSGAFTLNAARYRKLPNALCEVYVEFFKPTGSRSGAITVNLPFEVKEPFAGSGRRSGTGLYTPCCLFAPMGSTLNVTDYDGSDPCDTSAAQTFNLFFTYRIG